MGLTFVPTPLGNLRDITLRALDVLRDCDLLVAEDTRVARRLLSALDLPGKEIWSYREQNAAGATAGIIERARTQHVAVVSDAGMPGISDPGSPLVAAGREAGISVDVLPGPCAFVCAAVLSGFDLRRLRFEGFVPRANGERNRALREALADDATTAFYESPNRIVATLEALATIRSDVRTFVSRELSKRFEQQISGTPRDVIEALPQPVRGEIVLVIGPSSKSHESGANVDLDVAIDALLAIGTSTAEAARRLASQHRESRSEIYARIVIRRSNASGSSDAPS